MSQPIFLSSVTSEFPGYRDELARNLRKTDAVVRTQEDFRNEGGLLIELLDRHIKESAAVLHLVGARTGRHGNNQDCPKPAEIDYILKTYPDFLDRFSELRDIVRELSYTQWEAWLALYHERKLFVWVYQPDSDKPIERLPSQQRHLELLQQRGQQWPPFTDQPMLCREVLISLHNIVRPTREHRAIQIIIVALVGFFVVIVAGGLAMTAGWIWSRNSEYRDLAKRHRDCFDDYRSLESVVVGIGNDNRDSETPEENYASLRGRLDDVLRKMAVIEKKEPDGDFEPEKELAHARIFQRYYGGPDLLNERERDDFIKKNPKKRVQVKGRFLPPPLLRAAEAREYFDPSNHPAEGFATDIYDTLMDVEYNEEIHTLRALSNDRLAATGDITFGIVVILSLLCVTLLLVFLASRYRKIAQRH